VESVSPLSTNETYESIVADMSDHDKRPSHAYLLPRVSINTRIHAHGFRGRDKPSMTISGELQFFFENLVNQILNLEHIPRELFAFCMPRYAC
jgi:hypothetical protein